jgi:aminomethyltransferase
VIDDLTCYRLDDERYMLVVNAATLEGDAEWIRAHLSPETVFTDRSDELAKLDVQGPQARADLEAVIGKIPDLGYFKADVFEGLGELPGAGSACLISRTGYTGELGYELYFPASEAVRIWRALLANENIKPVGLGARDTLRLEMGYSLYGHELSIEKTPAGVSRGMFIKKDVEFIGRNAVMHDLENPSELLVALEFENKRAARAGDKVFQSSENVEIGAVTSGSVSPSLGKAVALALIHADCAGPGTVVQVEIRGKQFPATVVDLPFYKEGTARG